MKDIKTIIAPLASAFMVPGIGHAINGNLRKALCLMGVTFLLWSGIAISCFFTIKKIIKTTGSLENVNFMQVIPSYSYILLGIFFLVWLYGIFDSAKEALKNKKQREELP